MEEEKHPQNYGVRINRKLLKFAIGGFICDAPARAFITCTKYHSGFSSCGKCTQIGERFENRVVFSSSVDVKRTAESFESQLLKDWDTHSLQKFDSNQHLFKTIIGIATAK